MYGFYHRPTKNSPRQLCSRSGHIDQGSSFHSHQNHLPSRPARTVVCAQNSQSAWSAKNDHFRQRVTFYLSFLVTSPSSFGDHAKIQHSLSFLDRRAERVNQILEDMLRACALAQGPKWEDCLPYTEFSYNNSFQTSLKMSPYEALYGRKCRTPLN